MPTDAHTKAAEHHENAAKSHKTAAAHHSKGEHAKGQEEIDEGSQPLEDGARPFRDGAHEKSIAQIKSADEEAACGLFVFACPWVRELDDGTVLGSSRPRPFE